MGKGICRLCLKTCDKFQSIGANTRNILDILQLKINLSVSREPVICTSCAITLINSSDFIAMCIDTHHYILSLPNNKEKAKVNLKKVYLSKQENVFDIPEDLTVCGFCMGLVKRCSTRSLDSEIGDVMVEKCLPELDLSIINTPIICTSCQESLDKCFCFVQDCLIVEKKIKKYCENEGINSEGRVELTDVQEYTSRNMLKSEEGNTLGIIKEEIFHKEEQYADEQFDHKDESLMATKAPILNGVQQFSSNNTSICEAEDSKADIINIAPIYVEKDETIEHKDENFAVLEDQKLLFNEDEKLTEVQDQKFYDVQQFTPKLEDTKFLFTEDFKIKTDPDYFDSFQDQDALPQPKVSIESLPPQQVNIVSSVSRYSSESCSCQKEFDAHTQMSDKTLHKRLSCQDRSEITMHQCESCPFQTKYKQNLRVHMLMHKDPSEIKMYQCDFCSYQTKYSGAIQKHVVKHKLSSETTLYQCYSCDFKTKHKQSLCGHMLTHRDPSELIMHQCDFCSYQTKYNGDIKKHMIIHKSSLEFTTYQCEACTFKTKRKRNLRVHMLTHKESAGTKRYQCDSCSYQSNYKNDILKHTVTHKLSSEMTLYQCEACSFKTKHKRNLHVHMLTHKEPSQIKMHKCDSCSYQTKYKNDIQKHMVTHKPASEIIVYQCESCSFETKYKRSIQRHMETHKKPSDMYQCVSCPFRTKYKHGLKTHVLIHKSPSEGTK